MELIRYPMRFFAAALLVLCPLMAAPDVGSDLDEARKLYQFTDYQGSLKILQTIEPKDGPVYALIGQNHYMQGEYKKATESLEKAVAAEPDNSDYELWLGRAFGRRAETASPFTAPPNANKARQHFEKAVQLNPRNMDALSDLFEYYLEAPGFMGGGLDKAAGIADRMAAIDEAEGHWAQARLAERRKEFDTAEQHLRAGRAHGAAAGWAADRLGEIPGEAGPLPGKRTEFPQGREDRAQQPATALRARGHIHPAGPQSGHRAQTAASAICRPS